MAAYSIYVIYLIKMDIPVTFHIGLTKYIALNLTTFIIILYNLVQRNENGNE